MNAAEPMLLRNRMYLLLQASPLRPAVTDGNPQLWHVLSPLLSYFSPVPFVSFSCRSFALIFSHLSSFASLSFFTRLNTKICRLLELYHARQHLETPSHDRQGVEATCQATCTRYSGGGGERGGGGEAEIQHIRNNDSKCVGRPAANWNKSESKSFLVRLHL